ncbi:MAG TPA: hypothetical protein VGH42_03370 [Verrucomicrobiae bacterium]|jgi:hypothetical protein
MLCEIEYKQELAEGAGTDAHSDNHGNGFRVRIIAGRADRIQQFLKKQNDVVGIKIFDHKNKQA